MKYSMLYKLIYGQHRGNLVRTAAILLKLWPTDVNTVQLHDTVIPVTGIFSQFMVSSWTQR
jgi:hypothetical protein